MSRDTRMWNVFQNARINVLCYGISVVVQFFTRGVLLDIFGTEFMGLLGIYSGILGVLGLVEFGFSPVIMAMLYKPLFDRNTQQVNDLISIFGYVYRNIGCVVLSIGVVVSLFIPLIFNNVTISLSTLYFGFYTFLLSSVAGYFLNYKSLLLNADQKNYVVTGVFQITNVAKSILQFLCAVRFGGFLIFFLIELFFNIIYYIVLNRKTISVYPWLKIRIKEGRLLMKQYPEIRTKVSQMFVHVVGGFVQSTSVPLFLYSFVSLPVVALYANYSMIVNQSTSLAGTVLDTTRAGIGNLVAEGDMNKIFKVYKELFTFRFFLSAIFALCVGGLITDFIRLWLDDRYVLSSSVPILVAVQMFLLMVRKVTDEFIDAYVLFQDVWAPVVECLIFIGFAILFGRRYGLEGVLCAPIVSTFLVIYLWKPYFLFTKGLKKSVWEYVLLFFRNILTLLIAVTLTLFIVSHICLLMHIDSDSMSWILWVAKAVVYFIVTSSIMGVLFYGVSNDFRNFVGRMIAMSIKLLHDT